jgi:hypothetical protein
MYSALLFCAVVDLALSYNYFLNKTEIFVNNESNIEFVNFLIKGDFPFLNFIKFILGFPLLLFVLSWFDILHENIYNNTMFFIERFGRTTVLAVPSLFCISYSCSGLTWYIDSPFLYDILSLLKTLISSSIMIVLFSLFLLTLYLFYDQQKIV